MLKFFSKKNYFHFDRMKISSIIGISFKIGNCFLNIFKRNYYKYIKEGNGFFVYFDSGHAGTLRKKKGGSVVCTHITHIDFNLK